MARRRRPAEVVSRMSEVSVTSMINAAGASPLTQQRGTDVLDDPVIVQLAARHIDRNVEVVPADMP